MKPRLMAIAVTCEQTNERTDRHGEAHTVKPTYNGTARD